MATNTQDFSANHQDFERSSESGGSSGPKDGYEHNGKADAELSEKERVAELERIHTFERVGTHAAYYEKDGLRTMGDGQNHEASGRINFHTWMALLALSFLWTGSQIPVYLFGGIPPEIYGSIGGVDRWIWMILGNLLALAATVPFVGAMSDLFGRRYVAMFGMFLIVLGMIVTSTANNMNVFIAGMTIAGGGAGIGELTALAGTSELAPTSKRGLWVGLMVFTILPWTPSVMYAQLINHASSFRYVGLLCGVWAAVGFILVFFFYHPPPRPNLSGYERKTILKRIDFIGGALSICGIIIFLAGIQWGGYQYSWGSAHVLAPMIIGIVLIVAFVFWEIYGAKYPMFPRRLGKDPRILSLTLVITFISGANFFSILFFWPTQAFNMYGNDYIGVGLRGLPVGLAILTGAVVVLLMIGITGGKIRLLMVVSSCIMTAGTGSLAIGNPSNLNVMYGLVTLAGLGIGGIVVPASIISTIICPDDLIATITAITLSIRVIGGAIGYTIYYNVFINRFTPLATRIVGQGAIVEVLGNQQNYPLYPRPDSNYAGPYPLFNLTFVTEITEYVGNAQFDLLRSALDNNVPGIPNAYNYIVTATQWAFTDAYAYVYYVSIAFGCVSIIASLLLGDIKKYLDDHVAVSIE